MSIQYPDNDNRHNRLMELATNTQQFLYEATRKYQQLQTLCSEVNEQFTTIYQQSGLPIPSIRSLNVIRVADPRSYFHSKDAILELSDPLVGIPGLKDQFSFLAPAATRLLVRSRIIKPELAAKAIPQYLTAILGEKMQMPKNTVLKRLLEGIMGGSVMVGIDLDLDAMSGQAVRDSLRKGIQEIYSIRWMMLKALLQTDELLSCFQAVQVTLDPLTRTQLQISEQALITLITQEMQYGMERMKQMTNESIIAELTHMDRRNHSWTEEDHPSISEER